MTLEARVDALERDVASLRIEAGLISGGRGGFLTGELGAVEVGVQAARGE
jgi:hypothetical protein